MQKEETKATKRCSRCKQELPLDLFVKKKSEKDGHDCYCKKCHAEREKQRKQKLKLENPQKYQELLDKGKLKYYEDWDKRQACRKAYRAEHWETEMEKARARNLERRHNDPIFRWRGQMAAIINRVLRRGGITDELCESITGLKCAPFRQHLLNTFAEIYGYEWDGIEKVHIDHIIPLWTEETIEGKQRLCNYRNLRLIRASDNLNKGVKLDYRINPTA